MGLVKVKDFGSCLYRLCIQNSIQWCGTNLNSSHLFFVFFILFLLPIQTPVMAEENKQLTAVLQGNGLFTRNAYQILAQEKDKNIFFSPISIHAILSLAAQGSKGATQKAFTDTLKVADTTTLAEGYKEAMNKLNSVEDVTLHMANKVYVKEAYALQDTFKQVVVGHFLSEVDNIDFEKNEAAAKTINGWVEDKTKNKIKDLISANDLDSDTRLVLVNAIYFKGKWAEPFKPESTKIEKFYLNNNDTIDVSMMHLKKKFFFKNDDSLDAKVLELPYTNKDLSMIVILPNKRDGINDLEMKLANTDLTKITENMYRPDVIVALPKFKIETTINLENALTKDLTYSMSTSAKRKRAPSKKAASKKGKKSLDMDSDLSDGSGNENNVQPDEVLIAGHGDVDETPLPKELLNTLIKPAGQLVFFGNVNWDTMGKREVKGQKIVPMLYWPHRFTDLRIRLAVSGCVAGHSIVVTEDGKAMTFGRNPHGQLGMDDTTTRITPTLVPGLENMNIIGAACGRHHSLFLTDGGTVYACGDNKSGQCGIGNLQPQVLVPTRINYRGPPIIKVGAGAEFSIILDIKGGLHSFGLPEYGQLGHNTDGKYFKTSTKLCFNYQTSPKRIVLYIEKSKDGHVSPVDVSEIVDFSCGQNHTVAIDSKKRAFSWGFGGFGRLGHAEPKDEMVPRLIKYFDSQSRGVRSVHCGSTYSLAVTEFNGLFMFGQTKKTGEANMYPKPIQDLAGWNIKHIGTGQTSIIVSADESVIAWGASPCYGELGLGDMQKTSTTPKEVTKLSGVKVTSLAMGLCFTVLVAASDTPEQKQKLEGLKEYTP